MKNTILITLLFFCVFSCKNEKTSISNTKPKTDSIRRHPYNWIIESDTLGYVIKTQNIYYNKKDTIWNQLKIFKNNKLDTSRSYYFEKIEKNGTTELFYKPSYWHNFPVRKSYLRIAKNYQLVDSIKINQGKNTLNMLLRANEKTGEVFDIVTHYYDSIGYYKSTRMYLIE